MKRYAIVLLVFCLSGCVTMEDIGNESIAPPPRAPGQKDFSRISYVRVGMTTTEVAAALGPTTTIGYETSATGEAYTPITVNNPYRKDFFKDQEGQVYDVFYYFTNVVTPDGNITNDELTPLVFKDNILVGSGWAYLKNLKHDSDASGGLFGWM